MHFFYTLERKLVIKLMLKYELKKIFSKRINQVLFAIVFLIAIIGSFLAAGSVRYIDKEGQLHTELFSGRRLSEDKNRWSGKLTPEKIEKVVNSIKEISRNFPEEIPDSEYGKTMQSYEDISEFVIGILTPDSEWDDNVLYQLSEEQLANIYDIYRDNMKQMVEEYGTTPEKKQVIEKEYEKISVPMHYEAKVSWDAILMYLQTFVIILAVVIGFLTIGIFSAEFRMGTGDVLLAAKYGRTKAAKNKILTGIVMATSIYWFAMGALTLIAFGIMGISGFSTLYQISDPYSIYVMTYGEYYLLMLFGGYIASLFSAALTMLITVKLRNGNIPAVVPFFIFCMLPFIGRMFPSVSLFFDLMPSVFSNIIEYVKKPLVIQIGHIAFRQLPFVILLYGMLFVIILPFVYKSYRQYGLKEH